MPAATAFHSPAWGQLLAECYGYHPMALAIQGEDGEIKSGIPIMEVRSWLTGRRWIALPFTDRCDALTRGSDWTERLCRFLCDLRNEHDVPHIEVRSLMSSKCSMHTEARHVQHLLDLDRDPEKILGRFHATRTRGKIAKAEREGVKVKWAVTAQDMDRFYDLHLRTRHRLGVPVQPHRLFRLLWQRIVDKGLGFVLLAYACDRPVAGGVFLAFNGTVTFKYAASDKSFWHLYPNNLLIWTAIRWACENGYHLFDMGRTAVGNAGLRSFKRGWGTTESSLTYSVLSENPPSHSSDRLMRVTGALLQRLPRCMCRLTGELLYPHFP
jgi:CelD/BcsL family acetyltransferase involved in cellulose biosynthesis